MASLFAHIIRADPRIKSIRLNGTLVDISLIDGWYVNALPGFSIPTPPKDNPARIMIDIFKIMRAASYYYNLND